MMTKRIPLMYKNGLPLSGNVNIVAKHLTRFLHNRLDDECKISNLKRYLLSFQYSLLQTVVEACQKKRRCRFLSSPKTFGGDPCPGHRKFIEVAYKCRPSKFNGHHNGGCCRSLCSHCDFSSERFHSITLKSS